MAQTVIFRPIECLQIEAGCRNGAVEHMLRCICGSGQFELYLSSPDGSGCFPGSVEQAEAGEQAALLAKAICRSCGRHFRIFTTGIQAADSGERAPAAFSSWCCLTCHGQAHRVTIGIVNLATSSADGRGGRWFRVFSACAGCGRESSRWISLDPTLPY